MSLSQGPENSAPAAGEQPQDDILGLTPSAPEPGDRSSAGAPQAPSGEPAAGPAPPEAGEPWSEAIRAQYPEIVKKFAAGPGKLVEGYANLERYFHAFQQRGLSPEQVLAALEAQEAQGGEAAGDTERGRGEEAASAAPVTEDPSVFIDQFAANPRGTIVQVAQQVATDVFEAMTTARQMWEEARSRYPDIDQHEQAMREVLEAAPGLVKYPDVIDRLYRMASGQAPGNALSRATAEARKQAISQVVGTTVESGRTGAVPGPTGASGAQKVVEEILAGSSGTIPGLTRL